MSGMDSSFRSNISRCSDQLTYLLKTKTPLIADLKTKDNINKFEGFARKAERFPPTQVVGSFPELSQLKSFQNLDHNGNNGENQE